MTDSVYWIWFQLMFGVGTRRAELMTDYFENPQEIYDSVSTGGRTSGMFNASELTAAAPSMEKAAEILRRTLKKRCTVLTPDHEDYPRQLRSIYDRPAALYCRGDLTCLRDTLAVAMVGTRKHTEYGRKAAAMFAGGLAGSGAVIVSGLAPGIDAESHRAALEAGGKTIGVLGCGIDIDYPKPNRALKTAVSENGAVITEFPLGTEPYAGNFPLRNRIISGIAHATLVVEADMHSGSLITARLAREQGRDIFAVPGSIYSRGGQGTHYLIKEGARLADTTEDILSLYPWHRLRGAVPRGVALPEAKLPMPDDAPENLVEPPVPVAPKAAPKTVPDGLTEPAAAVYAAFRGETLNVDDLVTETAMRTGEILSALTELEIYGLIQSFPGRRFGLI